MIGWIKLHRQILDNPLWEEKPFSRGQAWVDLLLLANHEEGTIRRRGITVTIQRGEVGWGQRTLAERWGWSRGKLLRFFDDLKRDHQIDIKTGPKNLAVSSRIIIVNYEKYQMDSTEDGTEERDRKQYQNKNDKKETYTSTEPEPQNPVFEVVRQKPNPIPHEAIISAYGSLCPSYPALRGVGDDRKRAIKARWEEYKDLAVFEELFRKAEASDFLAGRSCDWKASFDWLMKPTNMRKVLEGNYDNKGGGRCQSSMAGLL